MCEYDAQHIFASNHIFIIRLLSKYMHEAIGKAHLIPIQQTPKCVRPKCNVRRLVPKIEGYESWKTDAKN